VRQRTTILSKARTKKMPIKAAPAKKSWTNWLSNLTKKSIPLQARAPAAETRAATMVAMDPRQASRVP